MQDEEDPIDISYKICFLGKDNKVNEVIVFSNQTDSENADFHFSEQEQSFIESNSIQVKFSKQKIHKDDSISCIKNKILHEIDFKVSYYELYLFSNILIPFSSMNLEKIFENISGKGDSISQEKFKQFLVNYGLSNKIAENIDEQKQKYFLDDFLAIRKWLDKTDMFHYKTSIGKKFRIHDEMFSANPYDIFNTTKLEHKSANPLESFENHLLMNTNGGDFIDHTIFVCFAEDVLEFAEDEGLELPVITSLYFPFLMKNNILDVETLQKKRSSELIKKSRKMASKRVFRQYESVDLFYNIRRSRLTELNYVSRGIDVFSLIIHPGFKHLLPLDIIFKNVHSTKEIPFIKYNPGFRRENIYRFYSENITKYGTKIPFLPAKTIIKLAKETGKKKQISFSVENERGDFYIDIQTNGDIHISGNNFKKPIAIPELNQTIQTIANPVIEHINDFLRKNGYEINLFDNIARNDIEIEYLKCVSSIKIKKDVDLMKYRGCLDSIFEISQETDLHKGANLRYKRVENYNEMNEEDIFISELYAKFYTDRQMADAFSKKFEVSIQESAARLAQFVREHGNGADLNKISLKTLDSPGFPVFMKIESYDDLLRIEVDLDNSLNKIYVDYVNILQMFMDSFIRITQEPSTTDIPMKTISRICLKESESSQGSKEKSVEKFDNVILGIDVAVVAAEESESKDSLYDNDDQIMFSNDMGYDNEDDEQPNENFDELPDYDLTENVEDIEKYEKNEDFELLSPFSSVGSTQKSEGNISLDVAEEGKNEENEEEESNKESSSSSSSNKSNNSLMFFGEEEVSEDEKEKGGASAQKSKKKSIQDVSLSKNIDGMVLRNRNNNIFLTRLKKREPTLFLSEDDGKFDAYSKLCQASQQRQPVILTKEEKEKIDENDRKNNSKSYKHALEYGTDPNNKHFYICPRFWCLKTNSAISEQDVKDGKCGKIIPKGEKKIPKGSYVYEFNHPIQHHTKGTDYKENTPGFLEGSLHPKGLCLPCCFKKDWDSKEQAGRRKQCLKEEPDTENKPEKSKNADSETVAVKKAKNVKQEEYIYEIRRYPIPQKRWGFLPMSVQLLLQTDNSLSINPNNNKFLKDDQNTTTLLRFGVENSSNKSFVGCIADVYAYSRQLAEVPTIEEMCSLIVDSITIDLFLKYQNGSLVSIFKPKKYKLDDIDPTKYETANFFQKLDMGNEHHVEYVNDVIASYENFVNFIQNKSSYIDHTYLWDIVCTANPNLFQSGYNLAIMRIKEADITDDIEILCPTSVYSSVLYDIRKETVLLLKHDDYYEPIYLFHSSIETKDTEKINKKTNKKIVEKVVVKKDIQIQKTFLEDISVRNIQEVLKIIRNSIQTYCAPQSSMPLKYRRFKKNVSAEKLQTILLKHKFVILYQVLNYQGKTVAFFLKYNDTGICVPCFPSAQLADIPVKYMDDESLWVDYKLTIELLKKIHKISKGEVFCKPEYKVLEDGLIVGVLTETNQFIMVDSPTENIANDGIPTISDENYILADTAFSQTKIEDMMRVKTIKRISLETQFFSAFRTTVRFLLNQPKNKQYKEKMMEMIENPRFLYKSKLEFIEKVLHKICDKMVAFKEFDEATLLSLNEITDCISNPKEKQHCIIMNNGEHQLILPEKHLISGLDNRGIYFKRAADELIRYKRIQLFMLDKQMYLNITNTEYMINEDEMIMLESLLTADYFKSLEPYIHGKNTKITYETANPVITQNYSNEITRKTQGEMVARDNTKQDLQDKMGIECVQTTYPITGNTKSVWKNFFAKNTTEYQLHKSVKCSYYPIIYVYNEIYQTILTVEQIKSELVKEYNRLFDKGGSEIQTKIWGILRKQGKRDLIDDVKRGKYTFETAVASEVYFLTNLDIWVLANAKKIPIILFHQKKIKHLVETVNWLKLADAEPEKAQQYYFVRSPTEPDFVGNYLPQYTMIKTPLKSVSAEIVELLSQDNAEEGVIGLDEFLENK